MLETSNLARKCTPICSCRKYTFQCLGPLNFADVSIFSAKNQRFLSKKSIFTQSNSVGAVLEIFQLFSLFVKQKVTITENITLCSESGLRTAPNWPEIRKITMTSQFFDMTIDNCRLHSLIKISSICNRFKLRGHPLRTFAKFPPKLTFLTP